MQLEASLNGEAQHRHFLFSQNATKADFLASFDTIFENKRGTIKAFATEQEFTLMELLEITNNNQTT